MTPTTSAQSLTGPDTPNPTEAGERLIALGNGLIAEADLYAALTRPDVYGWPDDNAE